MNSKILDVRWEIWKVEGNVIGVRTLEAKPQDFLFNHGAEMCAHMVKLHNDALDRKTATKFPGLAKELEAIDKHGCGMPTISPPTPTLPNNTQLTDLQYWLQSLLLDIKSNYPRLAETMVMNKVLLIFSQIWPTSYLIRSKLPAPMPRAEQKSADYRLFNLVSRLSGGVFQAFFWERYGPVLPDLTTTNGSFEAFADYIVRFCSGGSAIYEIVGSVLPDGIYSDRKLLIDALRAEYKKWNESLQPVAVGNGDDG